MRCRTGAKARKEMMSLIRYEPADSFVTPRFSGVRTFMRLPNMRDLENSDVDGGRAV